MYTEHHLGVCGNKQTAETTDTENRVATLLAAIFEDTRQTELACDSKGVLARAATLTDTELQAGFSFDPDNLSSDRRVNVCRFILSKCHEDLESIDQTIAQVMPPVSLENSWRYIRTLMEREEGPGAKVRSRLSELAAFSSILTQVFDPKQSWFRFKLRGETPKPSASDLADLESSWQVLLSKRRQKSKGYLFKTEASGSGSRLSGSLGAIHVDAEISLGLRVMRS